MSKPSVAMTVEPQQGGSARFLLCAPTKAGEARSGFLNVVLRIENTGPTDLHITKIGIWIKGSASGQLEFNADLTIGKGKDARWTQPADHFFEPGSRHELRIDITADGHSQTADLRQKLEPHESPTPEGSLRFWGAVRDLRPNEFWRVIGQHHANDNYAQLYAYDVTVGVADGAGSVQTTLPGSDPSKNESHRVWGKPVYAVADGVVVDFRFYFPTNRVVDQIETMHEKFWTGVSQGGLGFDGNGNFFSIKTGHEIVTYAHLMTNSLNMALCRKGAVVKAGDFLGRVGNTGAAGGPHLHIHSNRDQGGAKPWIDMPRPMPFHNAHAVEWASVDRMRVQNSAWVKLDGRGPPLADCAVWPSDAPVIALKEPIMRHVAISDAGKLWVIESNGRIRSTHDRLPGLGVFLDVDPGGSNGKEVALLGEKPFVIGGNDQLFEGKRDGWEPVSGSPACKRITFDPSTRQLWMIATDGMVWSRSASGMVWRRRSPENAAKDICAHQGIPYVIGDQDRIWKGDGQSGWTRLPGVGEGKRIAVDQTSGRLWVIGTDDGVYSFDGTGTWNEHPWEGRGKEILVFNGIPYILGRENGDLWSSAGNFGWFRINVIEPT